MVIGLLGALVSGLGITTAAQNAFNTVYAVPPSTSGGVLIADMLCSAMWQPLRAAAHRNMGGLATGIPVTKQLQFF